MQPLAETASQSRSFGPKKQKPTVAFSSVPIMISRLGLERIFQLSARGQNRPARQVVSITDNVVKPDPHADSRPGAPGLSPASPHPLRDKAR